MQAVVTLTLCPQMIHQQPNPGVHYEYVIMGNNAISPQVPPHRRPGKAPWFATEHVGSLSLKALFLSLFLCPCPLCPEQCRENLWAHISSQWTWYQNMFLR